MDEEQQSQPDDDLKAMVGGMVQEALRQTIRDAVTETLTQVRDEMRKEMQQEFRRMGKLLKKQLEQEHRNIEKMRNDFSKLGERVDNIETDRFYYDPRQPQYAPQHRGVRQPERAFTEPRDGWVLDHPYRK